MDRRPGLAKGYSLGHRLSAVRDPSAYLRCPELEAIQIRVLSPPRWLRGILSLQHYRRMYCRVRQVSDSHFGDTVSLGRSMISSTYSLCFLQPGNTRNRSRSAAG